MQIEIVEKEETRGRCSIWDVNKESFPHWFIRCYFYTKYRTKDLT